MLLLGLYFSENRFLLIIRNNNTNEQICIAPQVVTVVLFPFLFPIPLSRLCKLSIEISVSYLIATVQPAGWIPDVGRLGGGEASADDDAEK